MVGCGALSTELPRVAPRTPHSEREIANLEARIMCLVHNWSSRHSHRAAPRLAERRNRHRKNGMEGERDGEGEIWNESTLIQWEEVTQDSCLWT